MARHARPLALVAVVAVVIIGLTAAPTAATVNDAGSASESTTVSASPNVDGENDANTTRTGSSEWVILNEQTHERWTYPGSIDVDEIDLPPGEYYAKKSILRDGEREVVERQIIVENGETTVTPASSHDTQLTAFIPDRQISYTGGDTVQIVVGIYNETSGEPLSNREVEIQIEDPEFNEETVNVTTDSGGKATFNYTITSSTQKGEYMIDAESPAADSYVYESFTVGEAAETLDNYGDSLVGEERTVHFSIMNGTTPVSGAEKTVAITHPNGTETTRTITTDADGIAEVSLTPDQAGEYRVRLENTEGDAYVFFSARNASAEIYFGGDEYGNFEGGQPIGIGGYVHDGNGPLANEELRIEIINTTDYDSPVSLTNLTLTTDSNGNFQADWTLPDVEDATFDIRVFSSSGTLLGESNTYVYGSSQTSSSANVDIEMDDYQFNFYPGEDMEGTVTVTDENGEPVSNQEVRITTLLNYDGPPSGSTTVTTNESGQARYSIPAPNDVSSTDIDLAAFTQVNGEWIEDTDYLEVSQYQLTSEVPAPEDEISAGSTVEATYTLTDQETGDPVAGESILVHVSQSRAGITNLFADRVETNSTGQATVDVQIPSDTQREVEFEARSTTQSFSSFNQFGVDTVDAELLNVDGQRFAPGEEVTISYSANDDLQGPVYVGMSTYDEDVVDDPVLVSTTLSPDEQITVTVPTNHSQFLGYQFIVVGMNSSGASAFDRGYFFVEPDDTQNNPPTASFSYEPSLPDPGTTVTFNASDSFDADGEIVSYEWDLDGDGEIEATGQTAEQTYEQTGDYTVQLTVTDDNGATSRTTQTVSVTNESAPSALPGFENAPGDPDGDGKYEDLNGNGELDIGDIQALFANQESDVVQNNVEAFDFNNNGGIDIGDVQALFNEII